MSLDFSDLEAVYEDLATALDTVGDAEREVFLCKLSLLMARELGDVERVKEIIQTARNHLATA